jgi:hypothetical protein
VCPARNHGLEPQGKVATTFEQKQCGLMGKDTCPKTRGANWMSGFVGVMHEERRCGISAVLLVHLLAGGRQPCTPHEHDLVRVLVSAELPHSVYLRPCICRLDRMVKKRHASCRDLHQHQEQSSLLLAGILWTRSR